LVKKKGADGKWGASQDRKSTTVNSARTLVNCPAGTTR